MSIDFSFFHLLFFHTINSILSHGGKITGTTTGKRRRNNDSCTGGLEIPCTLTFSGKKRLTKNRGCYLQGGVIYRGKQYFRLGGCYLYGGCYLQGGVIYQSLRYYSFYLHMYHAQYFGTCITLYRNFNTFYPLLHVIVIRRKEAPEN